MKIVDYDTFCRMPAGTIFAPYTPYILEERLAIKVDKGKEMPPDYPYYRYSFNGVMPLEPWLCPDECSLNKIGDREDASFETYDGDSNDYRDYKMFLVFEEADIDNLISVLFWAKSGCRSNYYKCKGCPYLPKVCMIVGVFQIDNMKYVWNVISQNVKQPKKTATEIITKVWDEFAGNTDEWIVDFIKSLAQEHGVEVK